MTNVRSASAPTVRWLMGAIIVCAGLTGCAKTARQTGFMSQVEGVQVSKEEMRIRTQQATIHFTNIVERAGLYVQQNTQDPTVKHRAIEWKTNVIPAIHQAAFHHDPLIGLVDMDALARQLSNLYTNGGHRERFGDMQDVIVLAINKAQSMLFANVAAVLDSSMLHRPDSAIGAWARAHPLNPPFMTRESIAPMLMSRMGDVDRSAVATVGSMADEISALSGRLTIYAGILPRQARWEAELLMSDYMPEKAVYDSMMTELRDAMASASELRTLKTELPEVIRRSAVELRPEMQRYLDSVEVVVGHALVNVDRQMDDMKMFLREERVAAMIDADSMMMRALEVVPVTAEVTLAGPLYMQLMLGMALGGLVFLLGMFAGRSRARRQNARAA